MLHLRNMGLQRAERKGNIQEKALNLVGRQRNGRYMLPCRFAKFAVIRKGLT
jgi:hypothetical protein